MPSASTNKSSSILPFILGNTDDTVFVSVQQSVISQLLEPKTVFRLAADRIFFFGALAPSGQLAEHNFVFVDVSNAFAFTDVSGFNQNLDIVQYLGFTPRFFAPPLSNSLRLFFGNKVGQVITVNLENSFSFTTTLLRAYNVSNTLTGTNVAIAKNLQNVFDDFSFTSIVDSSASEYDRAESQKVIKQALAFRITNNFCPPEKTYSPFVSSDAATDGYPSMSSIQPTLSTGTLSLTSSDPVLSLTLKNPEFNNNDIIVLTKIDRRTRGGARKIFSDLQWTKTQSFRLSIQNLDEECNQVSVQDVVGFLNQTNGKKVNLFDWEGRQWSGIVVIPETQMRFASGGAQFDIVFEGKRIIDVPSYKNNFDQWGLFSSSVNEHIQELAAKNRQTSTVGSLAATTNKYKGAVFAPNQAVYGIPRDATAVLKVDTTDDTVSTFGSLPSDTGKWGSGVLAPNNDCVYGIPRESETVLKIDTSDDSITEFGSLGSGIKWVGGVVANNGKIYAIPVNSTTVLVIDPTDDSTYTFGSLSGSGKWQGGVLGCDGRIYGIPFSSTSVLRIDPSDDTTALIGSFSGGGKWNGGIISPENGCIYCLPYNDPRILKINTKTGEFTTFGNYVGPTKWCGGALGADGKIYGVPLKANGILQIDPVTDTSTILGSFSGSGDKWETAVLADNGNIYAMPNSETTVLKLGDNSVSVDPDFPLSRHLNKY